MQITAFTLRQLSIPLRFQFSQANNAGTKRSLAALLEVRTATGATGYGEACPRPYVTGETMQTVQQDLERIGPNLLDEPIGSVAALRERLAQWEAAGVGNSTRCAVELAWLDAWSRTAGQPLAALLGAAPAGALSYSLILPLMGAAKMAGLFQQLKGMRPPKVKFKVDQDVAGALEKVQIIRNAFGPDVPIRVDVNGGWSLDEALENIPALMSAGVYSFEEPLPAGQRDDLGELMRRFGDEARIMVDESLLSLDQARYLLENGLCNHFNLKISKLGGILRTLDIYRLAAAHNAPCQLGAHFGETSLLTGAGVLLAALAGPLTACEGAMGEFLLEKDIVQPSLRHAPDGRLDNAVVLGRIGLAGTVEATLTEQYGQVIMERTGGRP